MKKMSVMLIICFCLMIASPVRYVSAGVLTSEMQLLVNGCLSAVGLQANSAQGQEYTAQMAWEGFSEWQRDKLNQALALGYLIWEADFFDEIISGRDKVMQDIENGETIEIDNSGDGVYFENHPGNNPIEWTKGSMVLSTGSLIVPGTGYARMELHKPDGSGLYPCVEVGCTTASTATGDAVSGIKSYVQIRNNTGGSVNWSSKIQQIACNPKEGELEPIEVELLVEDVIATLFINGVQATSFNCASDAAITNVYFNGSMQASYVYDSVTTFTPEEGIDYEILNQLMENQALLTSLIGQTMEVDENGLLSGGTVVPPVPVTPDVVGTNSLLTTIWNTLAQGFNNVMTQLKVIAGAVSGTPPTDFFNAPIEPFKLFWTDHFPKLPTLDTSIFQEKPINWTITVHYPITATFEVLNTEMLERWRPTVRSWSGGILIFFTILFVFKKLPEVVKG